MIKKKTVFTAKYFSDLKALYGKKDSSDKNIQAKRPNDDRGRRTSVPGQISTPKKY